jgi:nucleoid-associated protein YgaU
MMENPRSVSPYERYGVAMPDTDAALRRHIWAATDTLSGLADRYLGDWREWRRIARRNKIADPRRLATGTLLIIPQGSLQKGAYESL